MREKISFFFSEKNDVNCVVLNLFQLLDFFGNERIKNNEFLIEGASEM